MKNAVKLKPRYVGPNIDKILKGADTAMMKRLNKRGQK